VNTTKHSRAYVLAWIIARMVETGGIPPTAREIGAGCGISSTAAVNYILAELERAGKLHRRQAGAARGFTVTGARWVPPAGE
jgi:SOS-response transcriptional repressor LexA